MQVLYPLMYLIYSLKMYWMYLTDLFERYVENGRQNVCGHYSQKVPSLSLPSLPGWWCVCWWMPPTGWAECGTGHPTHHSQKDWQQLLFGSNQSPAPYCPFTLPLSTCNLCFCTWVFVFYVRMCLHVFQIKPIKSLIPYLLLFDGQR